MKLKLTESEFSSIDTLATIIANRIAGRYTRDPVDNKHHAAVVEVVKENVIEALDGIELPERHEIEEALRDTAGFDRAHAQREG